MRRIRPLTIVAKRVSARQQQAGLAYGQRSLEAIDMSLEIRSFGVTEQVGETLAEATEAERQAARSRIELAAAISAWRQALGLLPQ